MTQLPNTPAILVSYVNMLLRDGEFDSLDDLAYYFGREPDELQEQLLAAGFRYNKELRQFRAD